MKIELASVIALAIIFIPLIVSVIFMFHKGKNIYSQIIVLILSIFSLGLTGINFRHSNLRVLNDSVTIVSSWNSGMPKEIKYFEFSDTEHLVTISYHGNGNISRRTEYYKGVKAGKEISFNQNSSVKKISEYVNGELIAENEYTDIDAKLEEYLPKLFKQDANSDPSNLGNLMEKTSSFLSPCCPRNYLRTVYHENGKIKTKEIYIDNKLNGEYIEFYENGNVKEQGVKKSYDKTGTWKYFDSKGNLIEEEIYDEIGLLIKKEKKN